MNDRDSDTRTLEVLRLGPVRRGTFAHRWRRHSLVVAATVILLACPPEGLQHWPRYSDLSRSSVDRSWLILKCTVSDDPKARFLPGPPHSSPYTTVALPAAIPDLDTYIDLFLTVSGTGTGNLTDYYHDVSYGGITMDNNFVQGWFAAPFKSTDGHTIDRQTRVQQCASAALQSEPAEIGARLKRSWGIIMVTNVVMDGGACYDGQKSMNISGTTYSLGCVVFDPLSMFTRFASHEVGHGLGLPHAFDNSPLNACGGKPGEYMDSFDVMGGCSPPNGHFDWGNYPGENGYTPGAGPGLTVPSLLYLHALPLHVLGMPGAQSQGVYFFAIGGQQTIALTALSHPAANAWLGAEIIGANANDVYTVEYRQNDGWDQGLPGNGVVIHEYFPAKINPASDDPISILQRTQDKNGSWSNGLWTVGQAWQNPQGGTVQVLAINPSQATATVQITSH